jgi:hypothetical protein
MNRFFALFIVVCLPVFGRCATETGNWDILLFGDKIGHMSITHTTQDDGGETFVLDSHSKAKILWIDKDVTSHVEVVVRDGKVISTVYKEVENGKVERWYNVTWNGNGYTADGYKGKKTIAQVIPITVVSAYFKDLTKLSKIFDEAEAEFVTMDNTEPDVWEFKTGSRGKNVFHAINGHVQNVDFHASIATVKMVKVK